MQNWFCVDAAAGRLEPKGEAEVPEIIIVSDAEEGTFVNLDGKSLQEEQKERHQRKWKRSKGVDRNEMRKEEKNLRYALLNGSAGSTERKYMRRYRGTFDVFFGIEHRLRKEEMEEQFNRDAKEGASAARITDERASSEDRTHTSGGVFVPIDSNLGAVVGAEEGAIESIPRNEGRIAQARVNVRGGLRIFSVHFWHSEEWSSRNEALLEAVLKRTRATKHPWLIACDAKMSPEDFEKGRWFRKEQMYVMAPEGVSTCRSRSAKGEWVEKVYDYVFACSIPKKEVFQTRR